MARYRAGPGRNEAGSGRRAGALGLVIVALCPLSACSFALPSLVSDPADQTGSITPGVSSPLSADLGAEDWRRAKAALAVAIDPQGNGSSVSWDNPDSGLKGTFVPVGQPFVQSDAVCRTFVATIGGALPDPVSLQATACRLSADAWDISGVKPWRRPA